MPAGPKLRDVYARPGALCFASVIASVSHTPDSAPVAAGVAAGAALVTAGALLLAGAPVAWLWLVVCAGGTLPAVVWFAIRGRLFEPLPMVLAVCALIFVARPLQLFLGWEALYSYFFPRDPIQSLILLEGQELAYYVTDRLREPLETAFARAMGACALFLVSLLAGYRIGLGKRLAGGLERLGRRTESIRAPLAVGLSLAIGLAAQIVIVVRAGGPASALEGASAQTAGSDSFALFLLSGFGTAALVVWVAWCMPRERVWWAALAVSTMAVCGLALVTGSRARVFVTLLALAAIVHYLHRRWRFRELAVFVVLFLAFSSTYLAFRNLSDRGTLSDAVSGAPAHVLDERVILNDLTAFDDVLFVTTIYGRSRAHEKGGFLVDAVHSYVPRRLDPAKPEGGDIILRRVVWGRQFAAGRPPTAVGDFYIEAGFWGVALGGFLVGIACRWTLGLLAGGAAGRAYRVALFALALVVLYEFIVGTFSIAIGFALTLLLPFLVAVHLFGRLPGPPRTGARSSG